MNRDLLKKIFMMLNAGGLAITYYSFYDHLKVKKNESKTQPNNSTGPDTSDQGVSETSTLNDGNVEVSGTLNTGLSGTSTTPLPKGNKGEDDVKIPNLTDTSKNKTTEQTIDKTGDMENQLTETQENLLTSTNPFDTSEKLYAKLSRIYSNLTQKNKFDKDNQTMTNEYTNSTLFSEDQKRELAEKVRNSDQLNNSIQTDLKEVIEYLESNGKSGSLDFINMEDILNIFSAYQDFLHTLSQEQLYGVVHIFTGFFILTCMFNIISAEFGIFLINYFKLSEKFPRLAKIIELRNKFQRYYFIFNSIMILLVSCLMIITNILVIFN